MSLPAGTEMLPRPLGSTTATRLRAGSGPGQSYMMKTTVAWPVGFSWPAVGAGAGAPASITTAPAGPGAHGTPMSSWGSATEPPGAFINLRRGVPSSRHGGLLWLLNSVELYSLPPVAALAFPAA